MAEQYYIGDTCQDLQPATQVTLTPEETHHLMNVCRTPIGTRITVFGSGQRYAATLTAITPDKTATITIEENITPGDLSPATTQITVAIPTLKNNNTNYLIEKLTELGIHHIIVYNAQRSVPTTDQTKLPKYKTIAINAAKQSEHLRIPTIAICRNFADVLNTIPTPPCATFIALERTEHTAPRLAAYLNNMLAPPPPAITIITGPEGGFHPERELTTDNLRRLTPITLGPHILRAETAPVVMVAVTLSHLGQI